MRFLLESGTYRIDNVGDIAMLQRAVWRLRRAYPHAHLDVVTERPDDLKRLLPEVEPVHAAPWFRLRVVPVPRRLEYSGLVRRIRWREQAWAGHWPRLVRAGKRRDLGALPEERAAADRFYQAVAKADAVIAAGGGYINDFYHEHATKVLATLNLAQGLGKPTAMFGIGLGPMARRELEWHGGPVLRRLNLLTLRENDLGPREAARLGVPADRIIVTGDDAIPIAMQHPLLPLEQRMHIGVNLRLSADAEVPPAAFPAIREGVLAAASPLGACPLPLVIRTALSPDNDVDSARRVFGAAVDLSAAREVRSPQEALAQIARCRVIVTGAYHNAVFALSMGIPVIGLSRSAYYDSKLHGVARQFGTGMTVLALNDPNLKDALTHELSRLWEEAPALQGPLQAAAAAQAAQGEQGYERFFQQLARCGKGAPA